MTGSAPPPNTPCRLWGLPAIPGLRARLKSLRSPALRGLTAARTSRRTWKMCFVCLGRMAHKLIIKSAGSISFSVYCPRLQTFLCLIDFCRLHPRLGSEYSCCQSCHPTHQHRLPGMENLVLPGPVCSTLKAACFCLWLGVGLSDTRPRPSLSLLSASQFSFLLIFTKALLLLTRN